jgi:exodeoxyribonuclease VII large subunit
MLKITVSDYKKELQSAIMQNLAQCQNYLQKQSEIIALLDPQAILRRGYAIIYRQKQIVRQISELNKEDSVDVKLNDGSFEATVNNVKGGKE